jgi:hypothetical protein
MNIAVRVGRLERLFQNVHHPLHQRQPAYGVFKGRPQVGGIESRPTKTPICASSMHTRIPASTGHRGSARMGILIFTLCPYTTANHCRGTRRHQELRVIRAPCAPSMHTRIPATTGHRGSARRDILIFTLCPYAMFAAARAVLKPEESRRSSLSVAIAWMWLWMRSATERTWS